MLLSGVNATRNYLTYFPFFLSFFPRIYICIYIYVSFSIWRASTGNKSGGARVVDRLYMCSGGHEGFPFIISLFLLTIGYVLHTRTFILTSSQLITYQHFRIGIPKRIKIFSSRLKTRRSRAREMMERSFKVFMHVV